MPIDNELTSARWNVYRQTWNILKDKSLSELERMNLCDEVYNLHAAHWCDLEIYPESHPVRLRREKMIENLPATMKQAQAVSKNKARGQVELL